MKRKIEVLNICDTQVMADVSSVSDSECIHFNATPIAKPFNKQPHEWLRSKEAIDYIDALITITGNSRNSLIRTRTGSLYGGTWLHNDLAIPFARWLSPEFAVRLDKWVTDRIRIEAERKRKRLEAKTGFLPLTDAVMSAHEVPKSYHYTNEINLINRIVVGMSAKQYKKNTVLKIYESTLTLQILLKLAAFQIIDTGLILIGMDYQERKEHLIRYHERRFQLPSGAGAHA